jgi:hypothetical protein
MIVRDDIFDKKWTAEIASTLLYCNWKAANTAGRKTWPYFETGNHRLLGTSFFFRRNEDVIDYNDNKELSIILINAFDHIRKIVNKNIRLEMIDANLQFKGMDGTDHVDGNNNQLAFILMLCNEDADNIGGEFFYVPTNKKIKFKHGRLIEIPAHHEHKGLSFTKKHVARMSIKWLGTII